MEKNGAIKKKIRIFFFQRPKASLFSPLFYLQSVVVFVLPCCCPRCFFWGGGSKKVAE